MPEATPIAIVGASCRLPGAPDPDALWALLAEGRDAVTTVPEDRFPHAPFLHPRPGEPGRTYTFAAGTLGDVHGFDATAFGLSPREATEMDPQQRLLLELAQEAIEDAAWRPSALAGTATAVFVGASLTDHANLRQADPASGDRYFMTGGALSVLANRIGHVFDLRGGAEAIDTACSSGLVALHRAARALADGSLPAAIVGGVNLLLSPFPFIGFARAGMLSPRGRCHAFDARADGYVRAEGGVVLVLKRLADAVAAGDPVRAVLLGSGVNGAGRTVGLSLPSGAAQQALLEDVLAAAAVSPERLGYFEAHGTGTAAGDPIEAAALGAAIGRKRRRPLPIGSLKTNIGHTEAASGLAGVLKAMLMLERRGVPPSLHFATPNPAIDFRGLRLRVATAPERLAARAVIGVNSFGFGGTNACALLGPPPAAQRRPRRRAAAHAAPLPPLLLSARSPGALRLLAARWRGTLAETDAAALPALLRGAARHRDLLPYRLAARGGDVVTLDAALAAPPPTSAAPRGTGVAFVFAGNGAQLPGMAQAAMAGSPAFRAGIAAADAELTPLLGWSVAAFLEAGVTPADLAATERAQPLLYAAQLGIVAALAAHGIRPALCLGHSVGEVAAAAVAGALSPRAAARLIVARSRAQQATSGTGRMAALGVGVAAAAPVLAACGPGLEVAAINAPEAITVAGPALAIARLVAAAAERRWSCVELSLDHAFHSAAMEPARAPLRHALGRLIHKSPAPPWISTVTGAPFAPADADYWWRNLREPVQFLAAVRRATAAQPALFLEIGPQPVLQGYLRECLAAAESDAAILGTLSPRDPPGDPFPAIADRAFLRGADPRQGPGFAGPAARRRLPKTPFDRTRLAVVPTIEALRLVPQPAEHVLLGCRREAAPGVWSRLLDTRLEPWLADHAFAGEALLPAAAMLDMALAAGRAQHPDAAALEVLEFAIHRPLALAEETSREVETRLAADGGFALRSRPRLGAAEWTLHASGRVAALPRLAAPLPTEPVAGEVVEGATLRRRAAACGLAYGPAFASVREVTADRATAVARVTLDRPDAAPPDAAFLLHPTRLDGVLQALFALLDDTAADAWLPVRVERLAFAADSAAAAAATVVLRRVGERSVAADLVLRDAGGSPVATLTGCWLQRARRPTRTPVDDIAFHTVLVPTAVGAPSPATPLASILPAALDAAADASDDAALLDAYCATAAHAAAIKGLPPGPYADALLRHLQRAGLALAGPHGPHPVADPGLPPALAIWRQALLERPGAAPELAWAAAAAERLTRPGGVAVLAPPFGAGWVALVDAVVAAAARALAADWPTGRALRVLAIAADGAGLAGPLAVALAAPLRPVRLCVAGSSTSLPCIPDVEVARLDWDPLGPSAPPEAFDLVVGVGAAMATRAGTALLPALRPALAPGGTLLLAEPLPSLFWDFCAGQDPAWWLRPVGPLPSLGEWGEAGAGWTERSILPLRRGTWPAVLIAARRGPAAASAPHALPRRFCLVAEPGAAATAAALTTALTSRGAQVARLALPGSAGPLPRDLRDRHIVLLLDGPDAALPATLAATARLATAAAGHAAGWHLVTRGGAQPEGGEHRPRAAAAAAWGRVLANELPDLAPRRIDLCPLLDPASAAARLLPELLGETDGEPEVTLGASGRLVPRLRPGLPAPPPPGGPVRLEVAQPGKLGSLRWITAAPGPLGPGEVRLRVDAAGLNFRDLMWAQGLLPESLLLDGFTGAGLGMECAGTVEAVGDQVDLRPGDEVFGIAPAALATHVVTCAAALARRPPGLDPAAAAALPVAFLTALHALGTVADLAAGERVLIHASAGAVGLAALQVARGRGARIAATAGTEAKRAFLRAAGAELVLDSRDPGFADAIRAAWGDADGSVDVVLNSLAGDAMERSLGLLRPFGRFLELGKRDFVAQHRVALAPLRRNASFHAIDIDALPRERPAAAARLLAEVAARLADGSFHAIPTTVFPAADVEGAFRAMQAATLIGKVVVTPPPLSVAARAIADPLAAALAGVTVVIGGTSGFGLEAARWLASRGATRLALISRRGVVAPDRLVEVGGRASVHACDATDPVALATTLAEIRATAGRIAGVIHAAALLADGAAASLDPDRIAAVLAAKLGIAEHLDRLTEPDRPDLFLLFSSAAVPVGNPGQAAYVAANAAIEALARRRRAAGRPALAVRWGPIADAGMLADADAGTVAALERRLGAVPMPASAALDALPALLATPPGEVGVATIHWARASALPVLAEPAFAAVAAPTDAAAGDDLHAALRDADDAAALGLLRAALAAAVGRILRLPPAQVAADAPLAGLGLDSLGALELRAAIEAMLGPGAPAVTLSETLTLDQLARRLLASTHAAPPAMSALEAAA